MLALSPNALEALLELVSSCAPLTRAFVKGFVLVIVGDAIDDELCVKCAGAVGITAGVTECDSLISFFMALGHRRAGMRDFPKRQLRRLELLSGGVAAGMFERLNLDTWTVEPAPSS
jgi:hypothetical protein